MVVFVLNETGDDFVQVFPADAGGVSSLFGADKPLDFNLELPGLVIEADIAFVRVIAAIAIIETRARLRWSGFST
jgi:hypothetical protein